MSLLEIRSTRLLGFFLNHSHSMWVIHNEQAHGRDLRICARNLKTTVDMKYSSIHIPTVREQEKQI